MRERKDLGTQKKPTTATHSRDKKHRRDKKPNSTGNTKTHSVLMRKPGKTNVFTQVREIEIKKIC